MPSNKEIILAWLKSENDGPNCPYVEILCTGDNPTDEDLINLQLDGDFNLALLIAALDGKV